ncbi:MAG: fibronectin type III domain-containing protein, partial [Holophagales bacterium]|nr:fibronectin type III domain-containing protein [Holophagales bacterium]
MTSQTFTASGTVVVGTREITFSDLGQALVAGLVDGGGTATLDLLRIASATAELETADDADLTAVWERSATAITIASGEHSATVFGPNHPGSFRDDSAPYLWIHGSSSAVIALVTALGAGAHTFTITLDDGVADTTTTVTANAGADKSVASGGTVQLDGSATVQNGQGATTWAWSRISGSGGSLDDATAQEPTFTAPTLQAGAANRQIVYELVATNNGVASEAVEVTITVTAPALQRPGPVRSLAAASEDGEANPTWEAPNTGGAVAEILVDYLVDSVGSWTGLQTLAADATTARITGLTNGQAITIRVRAQNTAGTSIAAEVGVTPMAAPPTPTAPVLSGVAGAASAARAGPAAPHPPAHEGSIKNIRS